MLPTTGLKTGSALSLLLCAASLYTVATAANDAPANMNSPPLAGAAQSPSVREGEAQSHIVKGANAAHEGDWRSALREFLTAACIQEHGEKALYHVGVAYYHLGRLEQARIAELLSIQANPRFLPAYIELATIETKLKRFAEAKSIISEAQKLFPNSNELASALSAITKVEHAQATAPVHGLKPEKVSPMAKSAMLYSAKDIAGLLREAEREVKQGELSRAKQALNLAVKLAPESPEPHWRLCQLLEAEGDTSTAIQEAKRAVALDDQNPQWYLALGWAYSRAGNWQQSFDAFKEAFKHDNNLHDAIVGECYALAKQKQITLARITLHVSDPEAHDTSWYHAANGLILEEKGDLHSAYQELRRACEIAPNDYQVHYTLARISYQLACKEKTPERWKQSSQHSRELLSITPWDAEVLVNLGVAQSALGELQQALETLTRATKIAAQSASAHAAYASALASSGRNEEAIAEARLAKKLDPNQKLADLVLQKFR